MYVVDQHESLQRGEDLPLKVTLSHYVSNAAAEPGVLIMEPAAPKIPTGGERRVEPLERAEPLCCVGGYTPHACGAPLLFDAACFRVPAEHSCGRAFMCCVRDVEKERERERKRERGRDRERGGRDRDGRQTDREREKERETERQRETEMYVPVGLSPV